MPVINYQNYETDEDVIVQFLNDFGFEDTHQFVIDTVLDVVPKFKHKLDELKDDPTDFLCDNLTEEKLLSLASFYLRLKYKNCEAFKTNVYPVLSVYLYRDLNKLVMNYL